MTKNTNHSTDKIIHCSVTLNCSPERAFDLFTENHMLESWLSISANVQPVVSGKYELFWDINDRENNSTIGCKLTAIVKNEFLSFEWKSPKQFSHFANSANPLTHVTVFFIPKAKSTIIHLVHSGWRSTGEWENARLWQEKAWESAFSKLAKAETLFQAG